MLSNIIMGLTTAFLPMNLLAALGGTVLGICFGAMPGLSATMGIAVLIPVSYGMSPATGLILLAGVYVGATYGGSISWSIRQVHRQRQRQDGMDMQWLLTAMAQKL